MRKEIVISLAVCGFLIACGIALTRHNAAKIRLLDKSIDILRGSAIHSMGSPTPMEMKHACESLMHVEEY